MMLSAWSSPVLFLAQATAAPVAPPSQVPTAVPQQTQDCPAPGPDSREIVICAERPQGYRINPDVLEAKRLAKGGGQPRANNPAPRPDCVAVGPAPCATAGVNILAAAATAAEMAKRLSQGQEIGSMFVTDPQPSEYQLYQMAKARREAEEAQKAAQARAEAARAAEPPAH